jgi:hypothetical protein
MVQVRHVKLKLPCGLQKQQKLLKGLQMGSKNPKLANYLKNEWLNMTLLCSETFLVLLEVLEVIKIGV